MLVGMTERSLSIIKLRMNKRNWVGKVWLAEYVCSVPGCGGCCAESVIGVLHNHRTKP